MKFVINFKKSVLELSVFKPLKGLPPKDKDLGIDETYLTVPLDRKLDMWRKSYSN